MFRTIVVGCDGSDGSIAAITLAARLRHPDGGRLVLTSVFPSFRGPGAAVVPGSYAQRLQEEADEILELSQKRVAAGVPSERVAVANRSVAGGLHEAAEAHRADLVVLGASHHHAAGRLTGRMTVQRLLHGAPCAVAVATLRLPEPDAPVIVAYDGSPEARHALRVAYRLAAASGSRVELITVIEPVTYMGRYLAAIDPEMERLLTEHAHASLAEAAAAAPDAVEVGMHVGWGVPADETMAAAEGGASLIVAGSRAYGTVHRAIVGSVSGALVTQGRVPALVTPRVDADDQSAAA
jgi:nucleotide-binding universal stress UspA family protein